MTTCTSASTAEATGRAASDRLSAAPSTVVAPNSFESSCLVEESVADLRPVAVHRLRLVENELCEVVDVAVAEVAAAVAPAERRELGQLVAVAAQQALDLRADLGLSG